MQLFKKIIQTFTLLIICFPVLSYAQEVVWKFDEYITKSIEDGQFILKLEFSKTNRFSGRVQGIGSLSECEFKFNGKGNLKSNPLYGRAERSRYYTGGSVPSAGNWSFISLERKNKYILVRTEEGNVKHSIWIFCQAYDTDQEDYFLNKIPKTLKFYLKE